MTYEESAALMNDVDFRNRVKVSCIKYADSILIEAVGTPAHNTRLRWATTALQNPDQTAFQTTPPVVMDAQVQIDGAAITDLALQGSVEATVNKSF